MLSRLNTFIGRTSSWLALAMVAVGAFNAIARYLDRHTGFDLSSNTYLELQWYLFSAMFLMCGAWVIAEDAHVRVDVFYARRSPRARALVNVLGTALLLLPFCVVMIYTSWHSFVDSWTIRETSPDPGGLVRYPLRALVPLAFVLLLLQGLAHAAGELSRIRDADAGRPAGPASDTEAGA